MIKLSPIRYPGSKAKLVKQLIPHLPASLPRFVSPFFGGGSFELAAAKHGIAVAGYDVSPHLVNFWQQVILDAPMVSRLAVEWYNKPREHLRPLITGMASIENHADRAAAFYALNKAAFSGMTFSGFIQGNITRRMCESLANFQCKGITVNCADYADTIESHPHDFLFCDPPYDCMGQFYGHDTNHNRHFNHLQLFEMLRDRDDWILTYSASPRIRLFYEGFPHLPITNTFFLGNSGESSNEVAIFARNLASEQRPPLTWI